MGDIELKIRLTEAEAKACIAYQLNPQAMVRASIKNFLDEVRGPE